MKKLLKISSTICGALLAVLGFSAVFTSCMKYGMPLEYGMPSADYFIDGNIVSEETNEPIKDLKVRWIGQINGGHPIDSVLTNDSGSFEFVRYGDLLTDYAIEIKDIDDELNGEFNDTIINTQINYNEYQGGDGHWYSGKYHKTFDIKLTPKN